MPRPGERPRGLGYRGLIFGGWNATVYDTMVESFDALGRCAACGPRGTTAYRRA